MRRPPSKLMLYLKRNQWQVIFYLFCGALLVMGCLWGYNYYVVYSKNQEITLLNNDLNSKKAEIVEMKKEEDLSKFLIAKYISENYKQERRSKVIISLIDILENLQELAKSNKDIVLSDFSVNEDSIAMNGTISNLKVVYEENGVIDQFLNLKFINHLNIPSYSLDENDYKFSLSAKINLDVGE